LLAVAFFRFSFALFVPGRERGWVFFSASFGKCVKIECLFHSTRGFVSTFERASCRPPSASGPLGRKMRVRNLVAVLLFVTVIAPIVLYTDRLATFKTSSSKFPSSSIDPILNKVSSFFFSFLKNLLQLFPFSEPNIFGLQFSAAKDEFIEDVPSVVSVKEFLFIFPFVSVLLIFIAQILVNSTLFFTTQTFNSHNQHLNLLPQVLLLCSGCEQFLFFSFSENGGMEMHP
jgi:hypothetical protein